MDTILTLGFSLWTLTKAFVLFGLAIYLIFALVVVRQVQLMTGTVTVGFKPLVTTLSYIHFLFAVLVFIFALIIL